MTDSDLLSLPHISEEVRKILASLDFEGNDLPRQALLDAHKHRDEIIPELLRIFGDYVQHIEQGKKPGKSWLPTMHVPRAK